MNSNSSIDGRPTAGIIIIGDEILKGHTQDTNSFYLCRRLHTLGVDVRKISVIPDDVVGIAQEVNDFSSSFTFVLTTGGVGPTHDDVTYAGIAKAFDEELVVNESLTKLLKQYEFEESALKMAVVPKSASVHFIKNKNTGDMFAFPVISVKNVYTFPGIPEFLEMAFEGLSEIFHQGDIHIHTLEMYLNLEEFAILNPLDKATKLFQNSVVFGTYPTISMQDFYKTKLTMESESKQQVQHAFAFLQDEFPPGSVIFYNENIIQNAGFLLYDDFLQNSAETDLKQVVRSAVDCLEECFNKFKINEVCLSFNGGKDCTVLLHLLEAVKQRRCTEQGDASRLQAVYFRGAETFPEIEQFVQQTTTNYYLKLYVYEVEIREGLKRLIADYPNIRGIVMGSRRTDPNMSDLKCFQMTDDSWPQILRINPLIFWTYPDIWMFIRQFCLSYCFLYDQGYSSLGEVDSTSRNSDLLIKNSSGESYKPADQLHDASTERRGRQKESRRRSKPS